ncbi:MAG: sulfotransferase [Candidatus Neomarinimicrobiota bacterium]
MTSLSRKVADAVRYVRHNKYLEKNITDFTGLPEKIFTNLEAVFVLSTGRAGTDLLERLFRLDKSNFTFHEPIPDLVYSAKLAYELGPNGLEARKLGFISARYHLLKECYFRDKRYIETNNKLTFFPDAIYHLMPKSKFIHLIRNPRSFVCSALRRKYYAGHDFDDGRIVPINKSEIGWDEFSLIQKNGWLWNETNQTIEAFKANINPDRIITIKSEELFTNPNTFNKIIKFTDITCVDQKIITKITKKPVNQQIKGNVVPFGQWTENEKDDFYAVTPLCKIYGF